MTHLPWTGSPLDEMCRAFYYQLATISFIDMVSECHCVCMLTHTDPLIIRRLENAAPSQRHVVKGPEWVFNDRLLMLYSTTSWVHRDKLNQTESEFQNWPPGLYGRCQHLSALAAVIQYSKQIPLGEILLLNGWSRSMHLHEWWSNMTFIKWMYRWTWLWVPWWFPVRHRLCRWKCNWSSAGYSLSDALHTTSIFCSICKISAIFILHVHLGEGIYVATNPTDFPLHLSSNGSFMYWERLIKVANGLTGKRCWISGWDQRRKSWKKWCGYINCTLQRKSVFFFFYFLLSWLWENYVSCRLIRLTKLFCDIINTLSLYRPTNEVSLRVGLSLCLINGRWERVLET